MAWSSALPSIRVSVRMSRRCLSEKQWAAAVCEYLQCYDVVKYVVAEWFRHAVVLAHLRLWSKSLWTCRSATCNNTTVVFIITLRHTQLLVGHRKAGKPAMQVNSPWLCGQVQLVPATLGTNHAVQRWTTVQTLDLWSCLDRYNVSLSETSQWLIITII